MSDQRHPFAKGPVFDAVKRLGSASGRAVSDASGLPIGTVSKVLAVLCREGYITHNGRGNILRLYSVTPGSIRPVDNRPAPKAVPRPKRFHHKEMRVMDDMDQAWPYFPYGLEAAYTIKLTR